MVFESIAELAIGAFAVMGTVIAATLTIQFATNASRNMSMANVHSSKNISKGDD